MNMETKAAIRDRLARLTRIGNGRLTPTAVVEDAQSEDSPLHPFFEWDDDKAAHEHRLDQARRLIRSVKINEVIDRRNVSVVAYVHDPSDQSKQGYVETISLINDRERALETLLREFTRIAGIMKRTRDIAAVLDLEQELDELLASINVFIERATLRAAA
jgi:hypothetical protein